ARLLQGAGEAIALPAAMSTIVLAFPEGPRRSRALAVWAAVASCGLVLGFVLSGVLTSLVEWRWIFLVSVPFIAVVIAAALLLVDRDRPSARSGEPVDLFGALLLTACPLLFTVGVVEAGEPTVPTWVTPAALGAAVLAGIGFVRVEARARNPLLPLRLLAHRGRVTANLTTMLLSGARSPLGDAVGTGRRRARRDRLPPRPGPRTDPASAPATPRSQGPRHREPHHHAAERCPVDLVPAVHVPSAGSAGTRAPDRGRGHAAAGDRTRRPVGGRAPTAESLGCAHVRVHRPGIHGRGDDPHRRPHHGPGGRRRHDRADAAHRGRHVPGHRRPAVRRGERSDRSRRRDGFRRAARSRSAGRLRRCRRLRGGRLLAGTPLPRPVRRRGGAGRSGSGDRRGHRPVAAVAVIGIG